MEREILFRGKRVDNGEWVYGSFVPDALEIVKGVKGLDGFIRNYDAENGDVLMHEVDRESVGQYTGLTDKSGRRIFEGDIVKTKKFGKFVGNVNVNDFDIFTVVYEPCMFRIVSKNRGFNLVDDGYSKLEVIGNIHNDPEMMGGEEK